MSQAVSEAVGDPVVAVRREVVDQSGWGLPFRIVQVRNFTFWVMAFLFVAGVTLTFQGFQASAEAYTESFAQGSVWFAAFAIGFLWLFSRLDRYSSIPAKAKVIAFLFSGLVSTFAVAALNNDAFRSILGKAFGTEFALDWGAGITAPWSEEIAKLLPVVLLIGLAPRVMRCAFDGLIIGAISGLAFQVFEDVAYVYTSAGANFGEASAGTQTLFMRTVLGMTGHWTWSAVAGAGLIYLVGRPSEHPRRVFGIALILSSMVLHGIWDSLSALTGGAAWALALYLPLTIANLLIFIAVYRHTVAKERGWARELLSPEVELGTISQDELDAAVGPRKQRRHWVKAQSKHRSARHVVDGVRDLADEIADGYGADTPAVEHARAEIARMRAT